MLKYIFAIQFGFLSSLLFAQQPNFSFPETKVPVTEKPINNAPELFRFAIMSDRTGAMLPGVFEEAVKKVNLLQPEFVLSVGDLIDGYTEDPNVWNDQWDEFEAIVEQLKMPFFFVPGNHDISNDKLLEVWKERRGNPWFHFVNKDVLFIGLHTEDRKGGGISNEQVAYVKKALEENKNAKWTLLFMHRPLWFYGDKAGYEQIEEVLKDRKFTLFSRHHHHYLKAERHGATHYILATTGGGSNLRGVEVGEFEHISWITMKEDGPIVAHISLDGIHDDNIVTEDNYELTQALRMGNWFNWDPILHDQSGMDKATTILKIINTGKEPLHVKGSLNKFPGIQFQPEHIDQLIPAGTIKEIPVVLSASETIDIHKINETGPKIELMGSYTINGKDVQLPAQKTLFFDWTHSIPNTAENMKIDGNLKDWDTVRFTKIENPITIQEDWDWKGKEDGSWKFATVKDNKFLYIAIEAYDDFTIFSDNDQLLNRQDKFLIHLDPRKVNNRQYPGQILEIEFGPGMHTKAPLININNKKVKIIASVIKKEDGFIGEIAIPLSYIEQHQGKKWSSIRLNIGWMDHDRPENTKPSILWWRPLFGSSTDDPRFANFEKESLQSRLR